MFQDKKEEANTIIFELVRFLLTGNTELKPLQNSFHIISEDVFIDFKQFFLNEFIFNYMFLNSDFDIALNNLFSIYKNQKELINNEPISGFLNVYLNDDSNEENYHIFKEKYANYFNGTPLKILQEKYVA
ncbi:hypothetical protein [Chryseobacterium sp. 3008163]|uniref:hypothetical protein n=1 Tax=Chryseobacterium sp. 3008163 TaxID=2478663 RepID=UPI000F0C03CB|nr:hypothetical protein [Chryseobacterium sp. 3008163]AYN00848.1 hypothetical protein EAG08_11475 [Chryseobacterium sp. 3008163]